MAHRRRQKIYYSHVCLKGRLNEKKFFQENSAFQNLGPKIIHEPKNLKKNFGKIFFSKKQPHQNEKIDF